MVNIKYLLILHFKINSLNQIIFFFIDRFRLAQCKLRSLIIIEYYSNYFFIKKIQKL